GVTIIGNSALPSTMPSDASKLYGKNILNLLQLMISKEGNWQPDVADDLVQGTMICRAGQIIHERLKS
ncbi:MAG TPA: NAD(P)(+) transhydrogenase (Re/Si-specific) subunit alpha, partial [Ferruginibacter sp.]|nr:NAD(P)(+) transhydrogenase (Re/Si-specific) subunit alpha [Ferruginibacter sp.]